MTFILYFAYGVNFAIDLVRTFSQVLELFLLTLIIYSHVLTYTSDLNLQRPEP
jgi:hypothetical protein